MKSQILNTLDCTIAWLERIEKEEPRVAPIINEVAKIKADLTPDPNQLELSVNKCQ